VVEATSEDKKVLGESENAVRIQIYTAITAFCMMAIVQKKMGIDNPYFALMKTAIGQPVRSKCSRSLFSRKRL